MTMIPQAQRPTIARAYDRFTEVTAALAGRPPEDDLETFGELLLLRDDLFAGLGLPATAHNSLHLYDCAAAALPLERFLRDADAFLPPAVLDDEGLLLSTLATYFAWREVESPEDRGYDLLAFLRAPYHPHNLAAVGAWLGGALPYPTMRAALSSDEARLDTLIC